MVKSLKQVFFQEGAYKIFYSNRTGLKKVVPDPRHRLGEQELRC